MPSEHLCSSQSVQPLCHYLSVPAVLNTSENTTIQCVHNKLAELDTSSI